MDDARLDAAAGHPDGEAERMMVAAVGSFGAGRAAELGRPDDERLVEQAALLEVVRASPAIGWSTSAQLAAWLSRKLAVGVPAAGAAVAAVVDLHEPHAALDQPPRGEAMLGERRRRFVVEAVQLLRGGRFLLELEHFGHARCMRNASSYDLIRASAFGSSGYSASASRLSRSSSSNSACCSSR